MNGRAGVESESDGAAFWIELRRMNDDAGRHTILLVDDDSPTSSCSDGPSKRRHGEPARGGDGREQRAYLAGRESTPIVYAIPHLPSCCWTSSCQKVRPRGSDLAPAATSPQVVAHRHAHLLDHAADISHAYDAGVTVYHVKPSGLDELVELSNAQRPFGHLDGGRR